MCTCHDHTIHILQNSIKIFSPHTEEECEENPMFESRVTIRDWPQGEYLITAELFEEESGTVFELLSC